MAGGFELLLGRRTYDIFHQSWPDIDPENPINTVTKYVVTHRELPPETDIWKNSRAIRGDVAQAIADLKA